MNITFDKDYFGYGEPPHPLCMVCSLYNLNLLIAVDGVVQKKVRSVDTVKGEVVRYVTDAAGNILSDRIGYTKEARRETIRGKVRVYLTNAAGELLALPVAS
jgi:hypothetical protein